MVSVPLGEHTFEMLFRPLRSQTTLRRAHNLATSPVIQSPPSCFLLPSCNLSYVPSFSPNVWVKKAGNCDCGKHSSQSVEILLLGMSSVRLKLIFFFNSLQVWTFLHQHSAYPTLPDYLLIEQTHLFLRGHFCWIHRQKIIFGIHSSQYYHCASSSLKLCVTI